MCWGKFLLGDSDAIGEFFVLGDCLIDGLRQLLLQEWTSHKLPYLLRLSWHNLGGGTIVLDALSWDPVPRKGQYYLGND